MDFVTCYKENINSEKSKAQYNIAFIKSFFSLNFFYSRFFKKQDEISQ